MKKIFSFLLFFLGLALCATSLSAQEERLAIYLCSRLTETAKHWNDIISRELEDTFVLFRPQDISLDGVSPIDIDFVAYQEDFKGISQSDLLLVLPPYGRDCAWEIGWFCGNKKPAIAYVEAEGDWLRDAMVKGGLTAIITNDSVLHKRLLNDPATKAKSYLIDARKDLGALIQKICSRIGS